MKNSFRTRAQLSVVLLFLVGCQSTLNTGRILWKSSHRIETCENEFSINKPPYIKYSSNVMVLTNAIIVDGTGQSLDSNQTIIVKNGIFSAIGNDGEVEMPDDAIVLNLKGKTIIPGIVGMHNHLHIPGFPFVGDVASKLYLASGITTIQTCGAASPYKELELSKNIASGNQIGPDIIPSAPFITGNGGNPEMIIPRNEQHLRDTMKYWINQGVRWFKVYRNITPEDLKTVIDEAHKNGCYVRGHLCSVTFGEAVQFGIDGIEHGLNSAADFRTNKEYGMCNGGREYIDSLIIDSELVKKLQQQMLENGVVLTSTLSIYEASIPSRAYADDRTLIAMSPYLLRQYEENRKVFDTKINDDTRTKRLKRIMQFEYQYYKMGGLLCSGVDAGRHVLPGFGDQRNYELLIEAGFSTQEAIQIMTGNGAKALGRTDIGTIEVGKRADFVILNGSLIQDASVIKNVEAVFKKGIGYDPQLILELTQGQFGVEL